METIYDSKDTRTIGSVSSLPVDSVPSITASGTPSAAANVLTVIGSSTTGNVMQFSNSAGGNFIMTNAGNVGIGTNAPSQKLHVNGNVYVQATTGTTVVNMYVAVAEGTTAAASSTDGINWTARTLPSSATWWAVTVNPTTGVFAAVAYGPSTSAASSTDGINWVARTLPSNSLWFGVTCNPTTGIFVAVAVGPTTAAASSTDGFNWVARTMPSNSNWRAVTVNPTTGIFAAVGAPGPAAASSTDGFNWTARTLPSSDYYHSVTVNPTTGIFAAIGINTSAAASSTDGFNWVARTMPSSANWRSVTVNPTTGIFAVVAGNPSTTAASSTDGFNWTPRTLPSSQQWCSVTFNSVTGIFAAISTGPSNAAASSTDGINWVARTLPSSSSWQAVTTGSTPVISTTAGFIGLGVASPSYQLDLSTDGARKLTTTTWLTGSDARIKTDVESANLQTCYETVKSLDLKYFKWNFPAGIVPDDRHSLGFVAQEVKSVFPNAVSASNSYGFTDFLSLNVDQIRKALFGAVKYLMAKVEALERGQAAVTVSEPTEPTGEVPRDS